MSGNKKADVNVTSLDRLKAELLRKQEEIKKAKIEKPIEKFIPKKPEEKPSKPQKEKQETTVKKTFEEYEDSATFEKAKRILQAKAKYYDKMVSSGGSLNSDENCLVLFNKKKQEEKPIQQFHDDDDDETDLSFQKEEQNAYDNQENNETFAITKINESLGDHSAIEEGNDWVEYTDCLGRTRQCLRKDFAICKLRDSELAKTIQPREATPHPSTTGIGINATPILPGSMSSLEEAVRTKYDQMKENWEQKEKENLEKEFIHYQDVFFDEARQHGVGYYAFSTDAEERARQMKELYELRAETLEEQKKFEAERQQRDIILAERIRAAENRLRARQGLPPLEDDPVPKEDSKPLTKEERKLKRKEEKMKRRLEREEKRKEEKRKKHVRPWDKIKVGPQFKKKEKNPDDSDTSSTENSDTEKEEWEYRPQREPMSQEQWNEKQREIRNPDFAPVYPQASQSNYNENLEDETNTNPFFFTTKKRPFQKKIFIRKNTVQSNNDNGEKRIPIQNEILSNDDADIRPPGVSSDQEDSVDDEPKEKRRGVEIAPPPTFEYYGPTTSKSRRPPPANKPDIESSIEAGLKYIRNQSDKGILPTKYAYCSKAEYNN